MVEVMTVQQAAQYVHRAPETIRRAARAGRLRASQVGRRWRIRKPDLDRFLAELSEIPEDLVDEGIAIAVAERKAGVAAGRERLVSAEEMARRLGL